LYPFNKTLEIRLGIHNSTSGTLDKHKQTFGVKEIIIHPDYNSGVLFNNDIALVRLSHPAEFNDYVQPLCITDFNEISDDKQKCVISGWGRIKSKNYACFVCPSEKHSCLYCHKIRYIIIYTTSKVSLKNHCIIK